MLLATPFIRSSAAEAFYLRRRLVLAFADGGSPHATQAVRN
jgi:hypothetical protein